MKYSKSLETELKSYGFDVKEYAYGTLVSCGWNKYDAYMVCWGESITVSKEWVQQSVAKLEENRKLAHYISTRKQEAKSEREEEANLIQSLSKEETLKALARARAMCEVGTKEWLDINKQIIDVTQMKKDEIKDEDNTVHFYLPISDNELQAIIEHEVKKRLKGGA